MTKKISDKKKLSRRKFLGVSTTAAAGGVVGGLVVGGLAGYFGSQANTSPETTTKTVTGAGKTETESQIIISNETENTSLSSEPASEPTPDSTSEKTFYKKSDVGTDVIQLTSKPSHDRIFYQEPNYFSPDNSKFLFYSRDTDDKGEIEKAGIYLLDLNTENITLLKNRPFGFMPTWSKDGKEVYVGENSKILAINIKTLEERTINIPTDSTDFSWIVSLHLNPSGDRLLFVESGQETHKALSTIKTDGSDYRKLFIADQETVFVLGHPIFVDDNTILFLTRGENRNSRGDFNKPYLITLDGKLTRIPVTCSHYDVNPKGDKILCGQDGYIIDLEGNKLKEFPEIHGHGVWAPDGDVFLLTGDPVPVPKESQYFGKIVIMKFSSDEIYSLVSHENTYNSSIEVHIQPNAQFSRDGKHIIYESDRNQMQNIDLYLVEVPE